MKRSVEKEGKRINYIFYKLFLFTFILYKNTTTNA